MGEKYETEPSFSTLKFPLLPLPAASVECSPEHQSGTATPPLQSLVASVPFKWEEEPGKPRPCTDIIVRPEPAARCLELPPCRMVLLLEQPTSKIPKMPSPTAVLDGPYNLSRPKFSSFRFFREARGGSFDSSSSGGGGGSSPLSSVELLLGKKSNNGGLMKTRRFFPRTMMRCNKSRGTGRKDADGGSFGFSPSSTSVCDGDERCKTTEGKKMRRNGSFSSFSQTASSHLWGSIYESLKQVVAWKSTRKSKKEGVRMKEYEAMYKV